MSDTIKNTLYFSAAVRDELLNKIINKDGDFDYGSVIPMPADIAAKVSSADSFEAQKWCSDNWDCKWNSVYTETGDDFISWSSPWNPPFKVITALSEKFPEETFVLAFRPETFGPLNGTAALKNGKILAANKFDTEKWAQHNPFPQGSAISPAAEKPAPIPVCSSGTPDAEFNEAREKAVEDSIRAFDAVFSQMTADFRKNLSQRIEAESVK